MKFSFGRSILKAAIERGLANGNLKEELDQLEDFKLKSVSDAKAVCWGLGQLQGGTAQLAEQTYALAGLFQDIEDGDCDAVEGLRERGIPELVRLFDEIQKLAGDDKTDALLFLLKIFALYGTTDGVLKIIEAARQPLEPDNYMWSVILGSFQTGHPQNELLYGSLSDPLPSEFMAVALLDAANQAVISGESMSHPFDSADGKARLRSWLTNSDDEEYSYAHSATAALPFISNPERDQLLGLAMQHPDSSVRLEGMWAAAKLGREEGFQRLIEQCRDFKSAEAAKHYLTELGREELIPASAREPDFAALAEFARWCAHPNELGRVPDELEIVDHRELPWPPERKAKPFWLIKYRMRDPSGLDEEQVGCGLVGSVTWCFFSYEIEQRPPEDGYAMHCYWEMENKRLIEETDIDQDTREYERLLKEWRGPELKNLSLLHLAEISPELNYPQRLVAVASASLNGEEGWVVLDGERSEWYPRSDMPTAKEGGAVLRIHVGRLLLGLTGKRERKKYLSPPKAAERPPEEVIASYEKLLGKAKQLRGKKREKPFTCFGPLGRNLETYAEALLRAGRASEIRPVVELLAPHWEHADGLGRLGMAAWKAGQLDIAEKYFVKFREQCTNYERSEEMDLLAEHWCKNARGEEAKELLFECLHKLVEESKTATGSDKRLFEEWFQTRRSSFLRLFPEDGEGLLASKGISASTLIIK